MGDRSEETNIGNLMADAPQDLQFIGGIDFIDLERNDIEYWGVGVGKIVRFLGQGMAQIHAILDSRDDHAKKSNKQDATQLDLDSIELVLGKEGKLGRGR